MQLEYLKKKGGARLLDVDTYKASCLQNKIIAQKSFKSANEVTDDEFVHVVKSILTEHQQPVVVKVHHARKIFIKNELEIMERLKNCPFAVKKICDFTCKDDTKRWMEHIKSPTTLCDPKGANKLHYIVMEYIENGDIHKWLASHPTHDAIKSFCLQVALIIAELAFSYRVNHGDLNSGNILVEHTKRKTMKYRIKDTTFKVKTHNVIPKLIDFGRGDIYEGKVHQRAVLSDIYILLSVICNGIKDATLKKEIEEFLYQESVKKKNTVARFIERLQKKWDMYEECDVMAHKP